MKCWETFSLKMFFFDVLVDFFTKIFRFFSRTSDVDMSEKYQKIYVKWGPETMVPVNLNPEWTVHDLKCAVASKICLNSENIRIIFAGKDLSDELKLQDCDVGEQTVVHAVMSKKKVINMTVSTTCSLNQDPFCSNDINHEGNGDKAYSKKNHFFVYCIDPCKELNPGKLRVRCFSCKEGTLTVDRDPTCWEDVLLPGRISGVCQSEDCNGNVAEFYFKCAKHVASLSDAATPLNLVKNNFKSVPCIACTGVSALILVFPCEDGHVICIECFQLYCASRLNNRRFIQDQIIGYSIDCPAGCINSLIKEPHHFKLLGEEQYSRYQRFAAEECVLQAGGVLCPQPGCGAGILADPDCKRIVCLRDGGSGCGFVFCRECMQGFHIGPCEPQEPSEVTDGINYAIVDERAGCSKWDEDSKTTIKITTKPCPKCRTPTERNGGCMHMVCIRSQCNFHWCWICQEEWTNECMGSHWFG